MSSDADFLRGKEATNSELANNSQFKPESPWAGLPHRTSIYGDSDALAGSFVGERIALSRLVPDGVYKFVVDVNGQMWLGSPSNDFAHSALVPRGEPVKSAGYIAIRNGRANVNSRSGHYMAHQPVRREDVDAYAHALLMTLRSASIELVNIQIGGGPGAIQMPE